MLGVFPVNSPIDRILNAFIRLGLQIFTGNNGYFMTLVNFITNNPYLLVSLSLVIVGFVISILKRMINL